MNLCKNLLKASAFVLAAASALACGSKAPAVQPAIEPDAQVEAWDVSDEALAIARENASHLGAKVTFKKEDILRKQIAPSLWRGLGEASGVSCNAIAVDAGCSGNPGPMEYQGIDLATGQQMFHFGPLHGTNNIGEFLAIVHALALLQQQGRHDTTIYSDSYNAILWVTKKKCKTKLERTPETEELFQIIARAEKWLLTHTWKNPIVKWETKKWGEIPADFGRK